MFHSTMPEMDFSDDDDSDSDEALDFRDVVHWDFAVLTGIELVVASPGKLRMLKHMSKYHAFEDYIIKWVL
ncbi:unnamed protein product [Miscanthus lutarioriparius]|uniref:Uncharacterized protein n=1 Tax=Miscanthus lutarioriparius TaxID=422564 RepID=A0A811MN01_9POAL|nr:unnamed protein product [Miscanthus lutarioriparius]